MGSVVKFGGRLLGAIPAFITGGLKNAIASIPLTLAALTGNPFLIATVIGGEVLKLIRGRGGKPVGDYKPTVFRQSISDSFIVYGKRRVGGLMVFFHGAESGGDHFRYFVIACAGHRCQGVTKWFLNEEEVTVNAGTGEVTSGVYAGAAWLWFVRGTATDVANATFVAETGGQWTTNHKGLGVAKIYAKFEMTEDVVQAGMPNITAEIEGKDDIDDPTGGAAGYTNLASRVFYDWMALPREEGGFGAYADEMPDDTYQAAQSNVCDETVDGEDRYTINAVITTGASPADVRDTMIANCAGDYTYSGGKHLMRPGYWVPPSEILSEHDLAGPIQVSAFLSSDSAATEVQGTYIEPDNGYQGMPFETQSVASSDIRQIDVALEFTTSKHQAERVASIMLKRAQCERSVVWPMNIEGLKVKALDTVQLDSDRYGLSNYAFKVVNWGLSSDWGVVLTLREENEDIYDAPSPVSPPSVPPIVVPDPLGQPTTADVVANTPAGNVGSTNVQDAINELDTEKVPNTRTITAGSGLTGGGDLSANRTIDVGAGTGITVNADDVALDISHVRNAAHPASSTDNAVARYDSTAGALQNSLFVVDDTGHVSSFGGNIAFPATQVPSADANTLDDYEEGTFTPALAFGGASVGITYTNQLGRYQKVGNRVHFSVRIILTNKGSSTGNATVTGLPFTSNASQPSAVGAVRAVAMTTVAMPTFSIGTSVTVANLEDFTGSTLVNLTEGDFTNTSQVHFTGSYTV